MRGLFYVPMRFVIAVFRNVQLREIKKVTLVTGSRNRQGVIK
jgi:hypothetical protein